MKRRNLVILATSAIALVLMGSVGFFDAYADEAENDAESSRSEEQSNGHGTSISLMPVSKILQLASSSVYEDKITVTNDGNEEMDFEVYAAPYSYIYSEAEDAYKLGFNNENSFTQITRWITFEDSGGEWVKNARFSVPANDSLEVNYRISTPGDIPAGGQYAVIFAHTLSSVVSASGIKTEASPGMVIYGRSTEGETKVAAEISEMNIQHGVTENGVRRDNFYASAKIKNTGNVDFGAIGVLKVEGILGGVAYETEGNSGRISVIPESELLLSDEWKDSPSFGIYRVTWTVTAGEETETIETVIVVNPLFAILILIIVLTLITMCVIMVLRKRKARRSRLAV